jgi:predicted dehydrogenase
MNAVRLGVVGLGRMGLHHVRCARVASGVSLVCAADVDSARREALPPDVPFTTDPHALLRDCDAIVLAVPTDRHLSAGIEALRAGKHLLVEKPLAASVAECEQLAEEARRAGVVLGVGHVERFNGAWTEVRARIERPRFAEGHRLAAFDPRGTEVDVILDLMIHDLDLVLEAFGAEPSRVEAVGVAVLTDRVDIANARLEFPDGALVGLTASRVSRDAVRKLRVFQSDAYFSVDLRAQEAEMLGRTANGVARVRIQAPEGHNPLVKELEAFAAAIRGEASVLPTAADGTRAVRLAERIRASIDERRRRWAADPAEARWGNVPSSS